MTVFTHSSAQDKRRRVADRPSDTTRNFAATANKGDR